ncbi:hypothetical protein HPB49_015520 [Dermacentor silvarum]|uniref:Uncharacterized protein n=1 Tax=Dermacentor silvarum TaxID=543639 RepID=A0ACB8E0Q8_DERSI|nr:hypothetical protein HPB49_015520 [Dermacentor silvarum]
MAATSKNADYQWNENEYAPPPSQPTSEPRRYGEGGNLGASPDFPRPVVTRAESTSSSSFELAWTFPKDDIRLYDGFSVKYCPSSTALCIKTQTKEKKLTVQGLNPDTTFAIEVRAQFRKTDGNLLLGPPASESVTTWKDVPDFRITYETNIQEDVGTHLLSWECVKSDLDYIQDNGDRKLDHVFRFG